MLNYRTIRCLFAGLVVSFFMLPNLAVALPNVGTSSQAENPNADVNNPIKWMGKKFIILELPKDQQSFGYLELRLHLVQTVPEPDYQPDLETRIGTLIYDKFVGDIITVTDVHSQVDGVVIEYKDDNKNIPIYSSSSGTVLNIAPADELDRVKKSLNEKKLWSKDHSFSQYDAQSGKKTLVKMRLGEPLTLADVVWGTDTLAPVWVIVKTNKGVTGYREVAGSPINKGRAYFDCRNNFYLIDPWKNHLLFPEVAKTPGRGYGVVRLGMDEDEVRHNTGEADRVNTDTSAAGTTEQWVYDFPDHDRYVYFRNGKVSSISEHQTTHPTEP